MVVIMSQMPRKTASLLQTGPKYIQKQNTDSPFFTPSMFSLQYSHDITWFEQSLYPISAHSLLKFHHLYILMYPHIQPCMLMHIYSCIHTHVILMYTHLYAHVQVCIIICIYINIYSCTLLPMHVAIRTYIKFYDITYAP